MTTKTRTIAEILADAKVTEDGYVFSTTLPRAERALVVQHLADRFGITLAKPREPV